MTGMVGDFVPDLERMKAAAGAGYATATDLADCLVRELGLPFREAHHVTGRLVALAAERGIGLEALEPRGDQDRRAAAHGQGFRRARGRKFGRSRTSYGGTAPANVRRQAQAWLDRLKTRRIKPDSGSRLSLWGRLRLYKREAYRSLV